MSFGLYTAVCGSRCQENRLEILSNNLANVSTAGFKEDRPIFRVSNPRIENSVVINDPAAHRKFMLSQKLNINYPAFSGIKTDFSTGQMKYTGNQLDVAIRGQGFFVVDTPQGELYTRMGNFSINDKNKLVTQEGYLLKGKEKKGKGEQEKEEHIEITGTEISFNKDGTISVGGEQSNTLTVVDTLRVVDFKDYSSLRKEGSNLFKNVGGEKNKIKAEEYEIDQHFLELSSVNVVKEMLKMIDVLRTYESYQKVIQSLDEIDSRATRDVGAVA
jgi:flagellar basal-body rod protein FlgF